MIRYALIYGLLSGFVVAATITAGLLLTSDDGFGHSMWFGYLVMLVALTFIFVGVKRYRDIERGGVIKFLPAFGAGLAIAIVAGVAYVVTWECYLAATNYRFIEEFAASYARSQAAAGVPAESIAADLQWMRDIYASPIQRTAMTFMEIFPVGFLVSLVSAAVLRNPKLLPAVARPA